MQNFVKKLFGASTAKERSVAEEATERKRKAPSPTIWLHRSDDADGQSWLGGLPCLPSSVEWPRQTVSGMPLHFLAQIDLGAMPRTPLYSGGPDLPSAGLLLFFADIEEEMLWDEDDRGTAIASTRVMHVPSGSPMREPPSDIPDIDHPFDEKSGNYSNDISVYPQRKITAHVIDSYKEHGVYFQGEAEKSVDEMVIASIERATGQPVPRLKQDSNSKLPAAISNYEWDNGRKRTDIHIIRHQLLGHAHSVQGTAAEMNAAGYLSLFQLDSDYGVHERFVFCDVGMIQFWIKPDDLAARRFDKAFGTTEGG